MYNAYNPNLIKYLTEFLSFLQEKGVSEKSFKFYKSDLNHFGGWLILKLRSSGIYIDGLHAAHPFLKSDISRAYRDFLLVNKAPIKTINRRLSTLRTFALFLLSKDLLTDNFMAGIENVKDSESGSNQAGDLLKFDKFLIDSSISQNTRKNYLADVKRLLDWSRVNNMDVSKDIKRYLDKTRLNSSAATYERTLSSIRKFLEWKGIPLPYYLSAQTVRKTGYSHLQLGILEKIAHKPRLHKLFSGAFFNRPNWYKKYHSYPLSSYINFAVLVIFCATAGYAIYDQMFKKTDQLLAFPTSPTPPNRYLSFQGRLTNQFGTPTTVPTDIQFKLYDADTGGTTLWDSSPTTNCSVDPDEDGIFSILLGTSGAECPDNVAVTSDVFSENAEVWLGVQVGADAEATPRIQIATVAYALNSETLQGYPIDATGAATLNTVVTMNHDGELVIGEFAPKIRSVSGTFAITGQALNLTTPDGSNGSIDINPDGTGTLNVLFEGGVPKLGASGFLNVTNANISSGALISGTASTSATTYLLLNLLSGSPATSKFAVDYAGNTVMAGDLTISGGNITNAITADSTLTVSNTLTANGTLDANGQVDLGDGGDTISIDSLEFDVSGTTGSITINDGGDAGQISIEGTVLDIDSLLFVGAGTIESATTNAITINSGSTGNVNLATDDDAENVNLATGNGIKTISFATGTAGNTINIATDDTTKDTINIGSIKDDIAITSDSWSVTNAGVLTVVSCTGCGGGGGALDTLTAATTDDTPLDSNAFSIGWNWDFQGAGIDSGLTISESSNSTSGTQDQQALFELTTLASSTASPLQVTAGGTDVGDVWFDLTGTSDFQVRDSGTTVLEVSDAGVITFTPTAGSDFILNEAAGTNFQILDSAAPTVDLVSLVADAGTVTDTVDGLFIDFRTGNPAGASTNAGINLDITSGGNAANEVVLGIDLSLTGTGGTERGINFSDNNFETDINATTDLTLGIGGTNEVALSATALYPTTDDGSALGILNTNEWGDLYLATGGIIGWDNNDFTITHSANLLTLAGGNISSSAAIDWIAAANTAATLRFTNGSTALLALDSRNTVTGVSATTLTPAAPTIAAAAGTTFTNTKLSAYTTTLTGGTGTTALNGLQLYIEQPTVTNATSHTTGTASTLYIAGAPLAAGSETITNTYAINSTGSNRLAGHIYTYSIYPGNGAIQTTRFFGDNGTSLTASNLQMGGTLNMGSQLLSGVSSIRAAVDYINLQNTGGNNKFRFNTTDGSLWIGGATADGTATATLDVVGNASTSGTLTFRGTTDPKINILNGENFGIQTSVGGDLGLTERLSILNSNGYVGIGKSLPLFNLDVAGSASVSGTLSLARILQSDAGACNYSTEGKMYYDGLPTVNKYYYCNGTIWTAMGSGGGGGAWSDLTDPTGNLTLVMEDGEITTFDIQSDTETGFAWNTSTLTTGNLLSLASTSTAMTSANLLNISATGDPAASWTGSLGLIEYNTSIDADIDGSALKVGITGAGAGEGTALNITTGQTGTAALALRVNDNGAYTDTTPLIIDAAGYLVVGHTSTLASTSGASGTSQIPKVQVSGTASDDSSLGLFRFSTDANAPKLIFTKSRAATIGSLGIVETGDRVGQINFGVDDGTDYVSNIAMIAAEVDGVPGANDTPGRLTFYTTLDGAQSPTERMRISNDGNVGIGDTSPASLLTVGTGDLVQIDSSGNVRATGVGQFGGTTAAAYSRFGTATADWLAAVPYDLLVEGNLELDGALYLDGQIIYDPEGTAAIQFCSEGGACATPETVKYELGSGAWTVNNGTNVGAAALAVKNNTDSSLFTAEATVSGILFEIKIDGTTNIRSTHNSTTATLVVSDTSGTGTGKIDVGTVDPPYTINGKRFATFLSGMVGVKEETVGQVSTNEYVPAKGYRYVIDFNNLPEGSDLWLFAKTTDIKTNIDKLVALLTPSFPTRVWYELDKENYKLAIYSARPTEVSYRLTGPRFDYASWANERSSDYDGFVLNIPDVINENQIATTIQTLSEYTLEKLQDGVYMLKDPTGVIVDGLESFGNFVAGNIKSGAIQTQELATNTFTAFQGTVDNLLISSGLVSPTIKTKLISPLADETDVTVQIGSTATDSGKLAITNTEGTEVASIDTQGNATFRGNVRSQNIDDIEALVSQVKLDQDLMKEASNWNTLTASDSASLAQLVVSNIYVTNQGAFNALSVSNNLTIGSDLVFSSSINPETQISELTINTLSSPLKIQSLALAPVEIMAGLVTIDTQGNVNITGNVYVAGDITTEKGFKVQNEQSPDLAASIDESGAAVFSNLSTQGLTIATGPEGTSSGQIIDGVITSNSTAGQGVIPSGVSEITISNSKVTDQTLVYVTPTSTTQNNVLYIKSKQNGEFTVGFTEPLPVDVNFNWWIIQVQN